MLRGSGLVDFGFVNVMQYCRTPACALLAIVDGHVRCFFLIEHR